MHERHTGHLPQIAPAFAAIPAIPGHLPQIAPAFAAIPAIPGNKKKKPHCWGFEVSQTENLP